jgi:hypothetical protein
VKVETIFKAKLETVTRMFPSMPFLGKTRGTNETIVKATLSRLRDKIRQMTSEREDRLNILS